MNPGKSTTKKDTQRSATPALAGGARESTTATGKTSKGFTDEEKAAMRNRAKELKIVCFFQSAQKFNTRYATFGFNDTANLDEGALWPVAFALKELTPAAEERISALVKKAVS